MIGVRRRGVIEACLGKESGVESLLLKRSYHMLTETYTAKECTHIDYVVQYSYSVPG